MFLITESFHLIKGRADLCLHLIKKGGTESVAEIGVVEITDIAPETVAAVPAFRNETMDMGASFSKEKLRSYTPPFFCITFIDAAFSLSTDI